MGSIFWRAKYMVAFILGDWILCLMGFSYNGKDENGKAKWNKI